MKTQKMLIITALAALAVALVSGSIYAYYATASGQTLNPNSQNYPNNYQNMMGNWSQGMAGMMGIAPTSTPTTTPTPTDQNTNPTQNTLSPALGFELLAIVSASVFGVMGLVYFVKYPRGQITTSQPLSANAAVQLTTAKVSSTDPYDSVSKTLTAEERQVLDVLSAHGGKYLQKYIRSETGLSRLKTHRIVSRLAERGIVTSEKTGNTNEVALSGWLHQQEKTA